jgi:hypothetical protein
MPTPAEPNTNTDTDLAGGQRVAHFDDRAFFEKALQYGIRHGVIGAQRLATMQDEAPKGIVQIARYFGSEFLRPELELARQRFVNLISLHLQDASGGDLAQAAQLLRDHSLLSRSKAGSDLLKALIVMPQNTHFGMNERGAFSDRHIPLLARWSLASFAQVQAERAARQRAATTVEAALWFAQQLAMPADDLMDAEPDAEAVIRTALVVQAVRRTELPDWRVFEKIWHTLRQKDPARVAAALVLPPELPPAYREVVQAVRDSVVADLPRLLDERVPLRPLLDQTPAFMGRYFWREDALAEVSQHDALRSKTWDKLTGGHHDDASLLTLLLGVAAGAARKTLLTEKTAASLVRRIRKNGFAPDLALTFLEQETPAQYQEDTARLWLDFVDEALPILTSDRDNKLSEAMALLRRECNVAPDA